MSFRALLMTLPVAFAVAAQAQPVVAPASSEPAMSPAQLADTARPMPRISPATGSPLTTAGTPPSVAATPAQPDGDRQAPDAARGDLESWFLRYGAALHRAE